MESGATEGSPEIDVAESIAGCAIRFGGELRDSSAERRFFSSAKGTLRIAVGRLFAASFARDVASSLASFAAAFAPSGPVIIFALRCSSEFSVERVKMGESVVSSDDRFGDNDVLDEGDPERRGGDVDVTTERETGGTDVEDFRRWTKTLNSVPLNSARGAAEMTSDPSDTSFSKCPVIEGGMSTVRKTQRRSDEQTSILPVRISDDVHLMPTTHRDGDVLERESRKYDLEYDLRRRIAID